jgi:hypothetical protein
MEAPPGTETDYYDMTVDEEELPGPTNTHPTSGRRSTGKSRGRFGYRPEGSAEEETPGPPPDFDAAAGPDESAEPDAKRVRFHNDQDQEPEMPQVPQREAAPPHQEADPEPETPYFDQESPMDAHNQQVPEDEMDEETPYMEPPGADIEEETPYMEEQQASEQEPQTAEETPYMAPAAEEPRPAPPGHAVRRTRHNPLDDLPVSIRRNLESTVAYVPQREQICKNQRSTNVIQ